jgi:hypothetical protein
MNFIEINTNDINYDLQCILDPVDLSSGSCEISNKLYISVIHSELSCFFISIEHFNSNTAISINKPYTIFVPQSTCNCHSINNTIAVSNSISVDALFNIKVFNLLGELIPNEILQATPIYIEYKKNCTYKKLHVLKTTPKS